MHHIIVGINIENHPEYANGVLFVDHLETTSYISLYLKYDKKTFLMTRKQHS